VLIILQDSAFTQWRSDDECGVLWIHGDLGKAKKMMIIALVDSAASFRNTCSARVATGVSTSRAARKW